MRLLLQTSNRSLLQCPPSLRFSPKQDASFEIPGYGPVDVNILSYLFITQRKFAPYIKDVVCYVELPRKHVIKTYLPTALSDFTTWALEKERINIVRPEV